MRSSSSGVDGLIFDETMRELGRDDVGVKTGALSDLWLRTLLVEEGGTRRARTSWSRSFGSVSEGLTCAESGAEILSALSRCSPCGPGALSLDAFAITVLLVLATGSGGAATAFVAELEGTAFARASGSAALDASEVEDDSALRGVKRESSVDEGL